MLTIDGLKSTGFNRPIGNKACQDRDVYQRVLDDFKLPLQEVEDTISKKITLSSDFEKSVRLFSNRELSITKSTLKDMWRHVSTKEKLSKATLDVLALFAGSQNWDDFKQVLHGENNGDLEGEGHFRRLCHG